MLDRCQGLLFKNFFYDAACDSKSLNCNIIMQKRFFWLLRQLLTNLLSFLPLHNSVIFLFRHFFHFPSTTTTTFLLFSLLLNSAVLPPPPPLHFSLFSSSFSSSFYCSRPSSHFYCFPSLFSSFLLFPFYLFLLFCLLRLLFISHCFPPPSRPHSIVPVPLLISIVFRPFSPHFYCFPSTYFCCFASSASSSFLIVFLLLLVLILLFPSLFSFLLFSVPFLLISIVSLLLISVVFTLPPHFCCFASCHLFTIFT